jgi:hypothetical protein
MKITSQHLLIAYSSALSTACAIVMLIGAKAHGTRTFDELQVQRIDIVEPNGTLRMVISNHDRLPGVIVKGKEAPPSDRPQAGMLFYNNEGSENGGLIFGGHRNGKGEVVESGGSLSFDKYGANQIVQLAGVDDKDDRFAGLDVSEYNGSNRDRRVWVGRTDDGTASVFLMGADGKKRIVMQVTADGKPSLTFLDEKGQVIQNLVPALRK